MSIEYYLTEPAKEIANGQLLLSAPRTGDAGYDLKSIEDTIIYAQTQQIIHTGIHIAIPEGYVGVVKDRSSVASKGLHVLAGVIDSSYRGELKIVLINLSKNYYRINPLDKIAQLLIIPHLDWHVAEVQSLVELGTTDRNSNGFGSTGK